MRAFKIVTSDGDYGRHDFEEIKEIFHKALKGTLHIEAIFEIPPSGKEMLADAIAYAINSVVSGEVNVTFERLLISELWHALNRRKMVPNDMVETYITKTYERLQVLRTSLDFQVRA